MNNTKQYLDQQEALLQNKIVFFMKDFEIGTPLNKNGIRKLRDYDGMVAHIAIAMSRYISLRFEYRNHDTPRTLGSLFFACSDGMEDLSLVEALQRILSLAMEKIRSTGIVAKNIALSFPDSVMSIAIDMEQTGQRLFRNSSTITGY